MDDALKFILFFSGILILLGVIIDVLRKQPLSSLSISRKNNELLNCILTPPRIKKQNKGRRNKVKMEAKEAEIEAQDEMYDFDDDFNLLQEDEPIKLSGQEIIDPLNDELLQHKRNLFGDRREKSSVAALDEVLMKKKHQVISENSAKEELPAIQDTDIITFTIQSRDPNGFAGDLLKSSVVSANFHYVENRKVFNRYDHTNGTGEKLFSLVNAVEPGIFDLKHLSSQRIKAVTLLLIKSQLKNPAKAFDEMVKATKLLAFKLNGEILDKQYKPLTLPVIEKYRKSLLIKN